MLLEIVCARPLALALGLELLFYTYAPFALGLEAFHTYVYNHARRPRLEKLLSTNFQRAFSSFKPLLDPGGGFASETETERIFWELNARSRSRVIHNTSVTWNRLRPPSYFTRTYITTPTASALEKLFYLHIEPPGSRSPSGFFTTSGFWIQGRRFQKQNGRFVTVSEAKRL